MAEFKCECGWKGTSERGLMTHQSRYCKLAQQNAVVESEEPGEQAEVGVEALKAELARKDEELKRMRAEKGLTEIGEVIEFGNGAKYQNVGQCMACLTPVYQCITNRVRDDGAIGNRLAVYVAGARPPAPLAGETAIVPEPPSLYCQAHDPTRTMRHGGIRLEPGEPMKEQYWNKLDGGF